MRLLPCLKLSFRMPFNLTLNLTYGQVKMTILRLKNNLSGDISDAPTFLQPFGCLFRSQLRFSCRWFNFEKVIKSLVAANIQYLGLKDLRTIVRKVCFIEDEREMNTMLDFYHDLGIIVKHRNTVILQSQWLIDIFRKLITIRHFNDMVI